nr:MAG TPA: hypothetical protein [Caudoviricetes sp.]
MSSFMSFFNFILILKKSFVKSFLSFFYFYIFLCLFLCFSCIIIKEVYIK